MAHGNYSGGVISARRLYLDSPNRARFGSAGRSGNAIPAGTRVARRSGRSTINYSYGYDAGGRLEAVSDGTHEATYSYLANSPLVNTVTFRENSDVPMVTTKQYDFLNRLTSISSAPTSSGASPLSFGYSYNDANQRARRDEADGSYWNYEYDSLGQVRRGSKFFSDGTPVPGQQFEYAHDDIGNRTQTKAGGDENGANLRVNNYTANSLNQYSSRSVAGAVDVMGVALAGSSVTVNSQTPYRRGEYFRKELSVNNTSAAVWQSVSVAATGETTVNGNVFVPKTPELYDDPATTTVNEGYDLDGNQLRDGRWTYEWDGENRLKTMRSLGGSPAPERRLVFEYDSKGRRIRKTVWNDRDDGQGSEVSDTAFVYDGWNLIAELDANNGNAAKRSFLWGSDLSGTEQGAGGVGGLLAVNDAANGVHFCAYDGNGNVAGLVRATDGAVSANYEYGPFGEPLRADTVVAKANPFRFSTKFHDDETDLLYYGYRSYNANLGRWLNRDPLEETGGRNMYCFVLNDPLDALDPDGRLTITLPWWTPHGAAAAVGSAIGFCANRALCRRGRDLTFRLAEAQADANAPDGSTHQGSPAGSDADMLTHCIAACEMARKPGLCGGPDRALDFMQEREAPFLTNPASDIDRLNNEAGVGVGISSQWEGKNCTEACLDALDIGLLYTIRNGIPTPSPPRRR